MIFCLCFCSFVLLGGGGGGYTLTDRLNFFFFHLLLKKAKSFPQLCFSWRKGKPDVFLTLVPIHEREDKMGLTPQRVQRKLSTLPHT